MSAPLYTWWTDHYIAAAQAAYPETCADNELAVGWKITAPNGTTRSGAYYWPLVNGDHDAPVLHTATAWDATNLSSCPAAPGDGLCLITQGVNIREATSGGARFTECVGHVLVYPAALALGSSDKLRVPWCVAVDAFSPLEMIRLGGVSAYLSGADLSGADLSGAHLAGANLAGANLAGANLAEANLAGAYLAGAYLAGADLAGANLAGANLAEADLFGAHLFGAHLAGANLAGADLFGAHLFGADLAGADLFGADLFGAHLFGAHWDEYTRWPAGFTPPSVTS